MSFINLTRVYGTTARTIKTWLKGLNACGSTSSDIMKLWLKGLCTMGSTVSPQLVQWASELFTLPKDRLLADARSSVKAELHEPK